ncbi:MAG: hypothetical protein ACREIP_14600, partial [Alphaproteobacteria bacterium]
MKLPSQTVPALWGAAGGAIVLAVLGFTWFGWVGSGKAERMATERADKAVVTALTPICQEKFRGSATLSENLAALKKISSTWEQANYIEKGGWATMPGTDKPNSDLARACAQ